MFPLYLFIFNSNKFAKTFEDIPVVYELIKKTNGLSLNTCVDS